MLLKSSVREGCCWHNVSEYSALGRVRKQSATDSGSAAVDTDPSLIGFGEAYYDRLSQLIDKHVELGTSDRVCYVGDARGAQVVPMLTEQYCLVKPVVQVNPYRGTSDSCSQKMEELFSLQTSGPQSESNFDKIIIYNSLHLFSDVTTGLLSFIKALSDQGHLLIIHRPIRLNTLPFPADVVQQLHNDDIPLEMLISTIQTLGLDFSWQVEDTRVVTSRQSWLDMIQYGGFPPLQDQEVQVSNSCEQTSARTRSEGVRELTTGILRYAGDSDIEFVDRMVFLRVSRAPLATSTKKTMPVLRSEKNKISMIGPLEMDVTPEIKQILDIKMRKQQQRRNLFD